MNLFILIAILGGFMILDDIFTLDSITCVFFHSFLKGKPKNGCFCRISDDDGIRHFLIHARKSMQGGYLSSEIIIFLTIFVNFALAS